MTDVQKILDLLKATCEAANRPVAESSAEWIHRKEAKDKLADVAPALVDALERLNNLALAIQNIGVPMEPSDVTSLISDALSPLEAL